MSDYRFSVIVPSQTMSHDETLDATDALRKAGCTDPWTCGRHGVIVRASRGIIAGGHLVGHP